jgi:hypothetical protein
MERFTRDKLSSLFVSYEEKEAFDGRPSFAPVQKVID